MQQRFLLQILLLAQHVSGTTVPIIRSSTVLYSAIIYKYLRQYTTILVMSHNGMASIKKKDHIRHQGACNITRLYKQQEEKHTNNATHIKNEKIL